MTDANTLAHEDVLNLLGASRKPLSAREMAAKLGLRHAGRRALAKALLRLKRRGLKSTPAKYVGL
jgi:hypothetical protein